MPKNDTVPGDGKVLIVQPQRSTLGYLSRIQIPAFHDRYGRSTRHTKPTGVSVGLFDDGQLQAEGLKQAATKESSQTPQKAAIEIIIPSIEKPMMSTEKNSELTNARSVNAGRKAPKPAFEITVPAVKRSGAKPDVINSLPGRDLCSILRERRNRPIYRDTECNHYDSSEEECDSDSDDDGDQNDTDYGGDDDDDDEDDEDGDDADGENRVCGAKTKGKPKRRKYLGSSRK